MTCPKCGNPYAECIVMNYFQCPTCDRQKEPTMSTESQMPKSSKSPAYAASGVKKVRGYRITYRIDNVQVVEEGGAPHTKSVHHRPFFQDYYIHDVQDYQVEVRRRDGSVENTMIAQQGEVSFILGGIDPIDLVRIVHPDKKIILCKS